MTFDPSHGSVTFFLVRAVSLMRNSHRSMRRGSSISKLASVSLDMNNNNQLTNSMSTKPATKPSSDYQNNYIYTEVHAVFSIALYF